MSENKGSSLFEGIWILWLVIAIILLGTYVTIKGSIKDYADAKAKLEQSKTCYTCHENGCEKPDENVEESRW